LRKYASAKDGAALLSSDTNEWYTLSEYIEAARVVLEEIDLDPATCEEANKVVKAKTIYTIDDNGLSQKWKGRVWLNPPWGKEGPAFVDKLIESYKSGQVSAAILLINAHATDTKWFQPLWDYTLCFTSPRIKYWQSDGTKTSPTGGSVFVYFGPDRLVFKNNFKRFGAIVQRFK
jgi:ParB family chromosome partitioning protein